jgi:hypothetical protein
MVLENYGIDVRDLDDYTPSGEEPDLRALDAVMRSKAQFLLAGGAF